jgi:uncharacterized repeat protein (TIGR01451 family)
MSTKRIVSLAITILMLSLLVVMPALAVHDAGLFELDTRAGVDGDQAKKNNPIPPVVGDGNTIDEAAPGDDWANVYLGTSSAFATSFIEDTFANNNINNGAQPFVALRTPENTFFTGGGSKDTNGIQDGPWKYKIVSDQVPDKNDIVNAFAAAYDDPNDGHTIFYFGLDTYSVNGDANAGFWFFRHPVGLNPPSGDTGTFNGEHTDGDIFVAVAYTQGGSVGAIDVYEWVGDDANGSLVKKFSGQDCAIVGPNDDVCGVINKLLPGQTFGEDPVFDYANTLVANNPLDPNSYKYQSAAFVEFGLDVNTILGQQIGCFTSFLAETRSSQSETAQLKDFAFGAFPICGIAVDKTGDGLSKVGDDVDYTIKVTNTGKATLYKQSITDTVFGDLTDGTNPLISSSDCGASLAPGDSCTIYVTRTVLNTDPDPLDNTVTVVYTEFADPASLSFTDSDDHSVNLFQPSITFDKSVSANLSKVGDSVDYTLTLKNTSSSDTPDLACTITDSALGISKSVTLASGASDVTTKSYTFQAGDSDPYKNTASVSCSPTGFPNVLTASDSESVNLFQPSITFDKSVSANLSKVGDSVDYTLTLKNTSSSDTPDLACTITDSTLGISKSVTLASGASDVTTKSYTFQAGDSDPYNNTASVSCSPTGFPNVLTASDSESVNLFQPSITFDKTGDTLSKVGDDVNYTLTLNNTSSGDTPDLVCTITDAMLGIDKSVTLASGASDVTNATYTVQATDLDPLNNTASVSCSPTGFPNVLSASDGHSVNLFQPSITFDKTGSTYSKAGDDVSYTLTLNNTSSGDTPDLVCTITDAMLGIDKSVTLASGASDVTNATYTVQAGDPDPLNNTASVSCSPTGFPNVLSASDGHSVDLIHPSFTVAKTCDAEPISYLGPANFTVDIANTGDVPLDITADDGIGAFQLAAGASQSFPVSVAGPFTPGGTADNTVTASWTLPVLYGLSNTDTKSASDSCDVLQPVFQTAYAMGTDAVCFIDLGANNWGWVNGNAPFSILPGTYTWDVWAGAGQCDTNNGTLVGTVTVVYDGTDVSVTFNIDPPYILGDTHVYAGYDQIPPGGFSPGQYQIYSPFDGSAIYIIVHAVVGIPQ